MARWLAIVCACWLALLCVGACAGGAPSRSENDASRRSGSLASVALGPRADIARGQLTYAVAVDNDRLLSVELGQHFSLVIRDVARPQRPRELVRVRLGSAQYDIADLAVVRPRGHVLTASREGVVRGFDIATGKPVVTWRLGGPATAVAVSPDGQLAAMAGADGVLCLRRYRDGALLQCLLAHEGPIAALDFSADGTQLASAAWTGEVTRWHVPSLAVLATQRLPGAVCGLAFAPRGSTLALARSAFPPRRSPAQVAREKRGIASAAHRHHAVTLWPADGAPMRHLSGHRGPVTSVVWTPDGQLLASGSWDGTVRVWRVADGREVARAGGFRFLIRDLAFDGARNRLAVGAWTHGRDGPATALLELHDGRPRAQTVESDSGRDD